MDRRSFCKVLGFAAGSTLLPGLMVQAAGQGSVGHAVPDGRYTIGIRSDLSGGVFDILEQECNQQISSNVAHLKASCGDEAIRAAMRLAPGEAMLLLDEICFNRLCHPVMRSLSYYTNFFDFSILRKLL